MIRAYNKQTDLDSIIDLAMEHTRDIGLVDWLLTIDVGYVEVREGKIVSLIAYYYMVGDTDVIMAMNYDNRFSKGMFKKLFQLIDDNDKAITINSDGNNKKLERLISTVGGYFDGDEMMFPKQRRKFYDKKRVRKEST